LEKRYQRNYHIKVITKSTEFFFQLLYYNSTIIGDERLMRVYDLFATPMSLEAAHASHHVPLHILQKLVAAHFLIEVADVDAFSTGICAKVAQPLGNSVSLSQLQNQPGEDSKNHFVFVGVPVDLGAEFGGARIGPNLLRAALNMLHDLDPNQKLCSFEHRKVYNLQTLELADLGNIVWNPGESATLVAKRAQRVFKSIFENNYNCITLGGDHSISTYPIAALSQTKPIHVIQFDAHHDLYGYPEKGACLSHANWVSHIIDLENVLSITQIGLRTFDFEDFQKILANPKWHFYSSLEVSNNQFDHFFAHIPPNSTVYVSFDVDCLDYQIIQHETGVPEIGGLTYYQAHSLLNILFQKFDVRGLDIVELTKSESHSNVGTKMAAQFVLAYILDNALGGVI